MKSLNNMIGNFFSNIGAKPMTLREFLVNLIDFEMNFRPNSKDSAKNLTDTQLIEHLLDWSLDDDFDRSRKIKGVNLHEFLVKNIDKPILISVDVAGEISHGMPLKGYYVYNLNVDGEEFVWYRYKLYPWIPNKPKKI